MEDLRDLIDPAGGRGEAGLRDAYKLAYALKASKILLPIKNALYAVVAGKVPTPMEEIRLVEDSYWKIAKKLVSARAGEGILAGPKAIECWMRDFSIPDTLIVYTPSTSATLKVSDRYAIVLKTAKTGEKTGRKNAFPLFKKLSEPMEIEGVRFRIAGIEHAMLDALITHKGHDGIAEASVRKAVSKYGKAVRRDALGTLVACKYLRGINRLRAIAKDMGATAVYEKALDAVKVEGGGCFGDGK